MSGAVLPAAAAGRFRLPRGWLALGTATAAYAILFFQPFVLLLGDWWNNPEAGHGLLLAPVALWLGWRSRNEASTLPSPRLGITALVAAVLLRYLSGLGAELFTMRVSMLVALAGLVLYFGGTRRLMSWWLPATLLLLAIPLPAVIVGSVALPLQFLASTGKTVFVSSQIPLQCPQPARTVAPTLARDGKRSDDSRQAA